MTYLLFLIFSCLYLYSIGRHNVFGEISVKSFICFFPIILSWFVIVGGQYNVGSDYFSYLYYFTSGDSSYFESKGDYLFALFIRFCNSIGIEGQGVFFLLSLIWILILFYVMSTIVKGKYFNIFFFVFLVFSGAFHNQMNGVRQYSAIYFFSLGICLFSNKKYLISILSFLATIFIHRSSIVVILIALFIFYIHHRLMSVRILSLILLLSFVLSFIPIDFLLNYFISYFEQYSSYYELGIMEDIELESRLIKYVNIPLVFYAIYLFPRMELDKKEKFLFVFGICSFSLKIFFTTMTLLSRIGQYFDVMSCVPLIFMFVYLHKFKYNQYLLFVLYLLLPYVMKVTLFATREYLYQSIFMYVI